MMFGGLKDTPAPSQSKYWGGSAPSPPPPRFLSLWTYVYIYIRLSGDIIANKNNQYNSNSLHTNTKIIIILRLPLTNLREGFGLLIAWPLHCGLDLHWQNPNPFSEKKRGDSCFWAILIAFAQTIYIPIFKMFAMIFLTDSLQIWPPCFRFFFLMHGGQNGTHVYRFFVCRIRPFGRYINVYLTFAMLSAPAPLSLSCRGTQIILISSIM